MDVKTWLLRVALLALCTQGVFGQTVPAWFTSLPEDAAILVGRGAVERGRGGDAAALALAKREAMRDLATSLLCRLTTEIIDHQQERDDIAVESRFASRTVVESALELVNVRTLHEAVTRDMAYAAVAVDRDEMIRTYRDRTSRLFEAARQEFTRAGALEAEKDVRSALAAYESCLAALRDAQNSVQVYLALNRWGDDELPAASLPDPAEVKVRLQRLASATPRTLKEIAEALASELTASVPATGKPEWWIVLPVEFEHTGFVSEFGHQLAATLSASVARHPLLQITDDPSRASVIVRGRMLREGESVLLVLNAGKRSVQHYIEPATCAAIGRAKLEPADLDRLLSDKLALHKAMSDPAGLRVEIRTDRLHDGPITYRYGDEPKLTVRADRACFIRLVYVTADGKRLLLLDRYPIAEHQANQWVRLPLEMEVCPPAGVEQMILQAVTQEDDARLPLLRVQNVSVGDGFVLPVIQETLNEAMTRTRGMMVRKKSHFAEVVNQWTVFPE